MLLAIVRNLLQRKGFPHTYTHTHTYIYTAPFTHARDLSDLDFESFGGANPSEYIFAGLVPLRKVYKSLLFSKPKTRTTVPTSLAVARNLPRELIDSAAISESCAPISPIPCKEETSEKTLAQDSSWQFEIVKAYRQVLAVVQQDMVSVSPGGSTCLWTRLSLGRES